MPTRKQVKAAKILAEDETIPASRALIRAGYSENTAKNPKQILETRGLVDALAEVKAERSDSARSIKQLAAAKLRERLERDELADNVLAPTWKVAHDIAQDEPETRGEYNPKEYRARLRRALNRAARAGFRAGIIFAQNADSPPKD